MDMGGRLKPSYKFLERFLGDFEPGDVVCICIGWFTSSTIFLCVYIQFWFNLPQVNWMDVTVISLLVSDLVICKMSHIFFSLQQHCRLSFYGVRWVGVMDELAKK